MFIYNITFVCEESRLKEFLVWVKSEFIPSITQSGIASEPQLSQVYAMQDADENDASSYSVQVKFRNINEMELWIKDSFYGSVASLSARFGESVLYFPTILEVMSLNNYN